MNRPSLLMEGSLEAPTPGVTPSLPTETKFVVIVHPPEAVTHGFVSNTCEVIPSNAKPETRSVPSETYATMSAPFEFTTGEKLGPFAITLSGPRSTSNSRGVQFAVMPKHVSRRKILDVPLVSGFGIGGGMIVVVCSTFVDEDVNTT